MHSSQCIILADDLERKNEETNIALAPSVNAFSTVRIVTAVVYMFCDSSAILSVLQTPPVVHKTASLLKDSSVTASASKSILSATRHRNYAAPTSTVASITWDGMLSSATV